MINNHQAWGRSFGISFAVYKNEDEEKDTSEPTADQVHQYAGAQVADNRANPAGKGRLCSDSQASQQGSENAIKQVSAQFIFSFFARHHPIFDSDQGYIDALYQ